MLIRPMPFRATEAAVSAVKWTEFGQNWSNTSPDFKAASRTAETSFRTLVKATDYPRTTGIAAFSIKILDVGQGSPGVGLFPTAANVNQTTISNTNAIFLSVDGIFTVGAATTQTNYFFSNNDIIVFRLKNTAGTTLDVLLNGNLIINNRTISAVSRVPTAFNADNSDINPFAVLLDGAPIGETPWA